jgi:hypothetical protein
MVKRKPKEEKPKLDAFDEANSLPKQPNHFVSVKPKDEDGMGYMYRKRRSVVADHDEGRCADCGL